MFKKIFLNKVPSHDEVKIYNADLVLRLMLEIAISDGKLDQSELSLIKNRALKIAPDKKKSHQSLKKL